MDVYCLTETAPYADDAFRNSYIEYATLHVPATSIEAYKTAAPWKNFKNIVEYVNPSGIQCITLDVNANVSVYDLNGRSLEKSCKGINIINGRKVLVK